MDKNPVKQSYYANGFVLALSILPVIAFFSARSMSVLPGIIALVFAALWPVFYKEKLKLSRLFFAWVAVIIGLCLISCLWAPDLNFALEKTGKIALVLLPGALLYSLASSLNAQHTGWFPKILPVSVAITGVLVALELALDLPFHRFIDEEVDGYISRAVVNRSIFCAMSAVFICIGAVHTSSLSPFNKRNLIAAALVLGISGMALSESQSNQLALLLGFVVLFAFPYRWRPAYYILAGVLSILILGAPWIAHALYMHLAANIEYIPWLKEGFASTRMEIWDFVARRIMENPITGYGVESTRFMHFDTHKLFYLSDNVLHPHNFVLQLWAEFGVAGALAACGFFCFLSYQLSRLPVAYAKMALPTLAYAGVVGAIGYGVWQGWWIGQLTLLFAFYALAAKNTQA